MRRYDASVAAGALPVGPAAQVRAQTSNVRMAKLRTAVFINMFYFKPLGRRRKAEGAVRGKAVVGGGDIAQVENEFVFGFGEEQFVVRSDLRRSRRGGVD